MVSLSNPYERSYPFDSRCSLRVNGTKTMQNQINQNNRAQLGAHGEELVVNHLHINGFNIQARNYTKRFGEVDIIAAKPELLVFVEVKLRKTAYFALSDVIVPSKQKKIIMTAKDYILRNKYRDCIYRFDVALVQQQEDGTFALEYIENAFTESGFYGW